MGRGGSLSAATIADIQYRRQVLHQPVDEVAKALGVGASTVSTYGSGRGLDSERDKAIGERLRAGQPHARIMRDLGVSQAVVSRISMRLVAMGEMPVRYGVARGEVVRPEDEVVVEPKPAPPEPKTNGHAPTAPTTRRASGRSKSERIAQQVGDSLRASSLRAVMLDVLATQGPFSTYTAFVDAIRKAGGPPNIAGHEVQHNLHALNRQGLAKYKVSKNGRMKVLTDIRATDVTLRARGRLAEPVIPVTPEPVVAGTVEVDATFVPDPAVVEGLAAIVDEPEEATVEAWDAAPEVMAEKAETTALDPLIKSVDGARYPVLDGLLKSRERHFHLAALLAQAAEYADPEDVEELRLRADVAQEAASGAGLSDVAQEYLRYVATHP